MLRLDGIIYTLINLVILYVAMRHFLIGPIQSVLAKRKEMIDQQFAQAQSRQEEAEQKKQQYDELLAHAKEESARMLDTSRDNAQKEYAQRISEAEQQASHILEKAQKDIAQEREKAMGDMQSQIAQVAMAAAGKILMEQADVQVDRSIYDQYITGGGDTREADGN